jgi:hypothetical protein
MQNYEYKSQIEKNKLIFKSIFHHQIFSHP